MLLSAHSGTADIGMAMKSALDVGHEELSHFIDKKLEVETCLILRKSMAAGQLCATYK